MAYDSSRGIYFGVPSNMKWIPAPLQGMGRQANRNVSETEFLDGGSSLTQSVTGSMKYEMDFGLKHPEDMQHLVACDQGAYGEELYFLDPFAAKTNILPSFWASPWMGTYGAPKLAGVSQYEQQTVATVANTYGYPVLSGRVGWATESAYWVQAEVLTLWIPVPNGFTFHFGVHGVVGSTGAGAYIGVKPDGGSESTPAILATTTSTLTNYTYAATSDSGVTLRLTGATDKYLNIAGMIGQVLPTGQAAPTGNFIPGEGHSGCRIVGGVQRLGYSVAIDREQYSLVAREAGNWRYRG